MRAVQVARAGGPLELEPIQVSSLQLIGGSRSVVGQAAGTAIDLENTRAFGLLSGERPMIEKMPRAPPRPTGE